VSASCCGISLLYGNPSCFLEGASAAEFPITQAIERNAGNVQIEIITTHLKNNDDDDDILSWF
jgi:hypothetical protein